VFALRINAKEFVRDVESVLDDDSLMVKYGLGPYQLQRVLEQLIDMNLLSQHQIEMRAQLSESRIARAFLAVHSEARKIR
jgi:hypothetical protein